MKIIMKTMNIFMKTVMTITKKNTTDLFRLLHGISASFRLMILRSYPSFGTRKEPKKICAGLYQRSYTGITVQYL